MIMRLPLMKNDLLNLGLNQSCFSSGGNCPERHVLYASYTRSLLIFARLLSVNAKMLSKIDTCMNVISAVQRLPLGGRHLKFLFECRRKGALRAIKAFGGYLLLGRSRFQEFLRCLQTLPYLVFLDTSAISSFKGFFNGVAIRSAYMVE